MLSRDKCQNDEAEQNFRFFSFHMNCTPPPLSLSPQEKKFSQVRLPVYHFLSNFKRILNLTLSEDDNSRGRQKTTGLLIIEMLSVSQICHCW